MLGEGKWLGGKGEGSDDGGWVGEMAMECKREGDVFGVGDEEMRKLGWGVVAWFSGCVL